MTDWKGSNLLPFIRPNPETPPAQETEDPRRLHRRAETTIRYLQLSDHDQGTIDIIVDVLWRRDRERGGA